MSTAKLFATSAVAGALLSVSTGWLCRAEPIQSLLIALGLALGFSVIAPLLAALWLAGVVRSRGPLSAPDRNWLRIGLLLVICAVGWMSSPVPAIAFQQVELRRARDWAELQVPVIEAIHSRTGAYPSSIEEFADLERAPYLWEHGEGLFLADADGFAFDIASGWLSGWSWTSRRRSWQRYR